MITKLANTWENNSNGGGKCPFTGAMHHHAGTQRGTSNADWWPNKLNLSILRQNGAESILWMSDFDHRKEFASLDHEALKKDLEALMTGFGKTGWPADYGHYGPFSSEWYGMPWATLIASAMARRTAKGLQRFAPLNSWPDNTNLDKAVEVTGPSNKNMERNIVGRSHDPYG